MPSGYREAFLFSSGKTAASRKLQAVSQIQLKAISSKPKANTGCKQYTTARLPRHGVLLIACSLKLYSMLWK
jgi:hypothetical protein